MDFLLLVLFFFLFSVSFCLRNLFFKNLILEVGGFFPLKETKYKLKKAK